MLGCVDLRIEGIQRSFLERDIYPVLQDKSVKAHLKSLHDKFVFVPVDKASNNIAIVCKRLYASVIYKELDFNNIKSINFSGTYEIISNKSPDTINTRY